MKITGNETAEEIIQAIRLECWKGWGEHGGTELADRTEALIREVLADYSAALGLDQDAILRALESRRDYWAPNFYQAANLPKLAGVRVFANQQELQSALPSRRFRCPLCGQVSTNPYECNSGAQVSGKTCDWKAYGFLRTAGKGLRFTVREGFLDRPIIDEIFMPLELEAA
jgi:hypothetical protein